MFLDTSGLLCLHHRAEAHHDTAKREYRAARIRLTHSGVLAEFVALANARRLPREPALNFITALIENPDIEVVWIDEVLLRRALAFLTDRLDKSYSLCDA